MLKPLHGAEPGLSKNLESFCAQDYRGVVQLLFGVQWVEDAAIPVVYVGRAVTHALPLSLIRAALLGFSLPALGACAAALVARLYLKRKIDHSLARRGASPWLFPLCDVFSFAAFVGSFLPGREDWRVRRYRVEGGGQLARE
jgi:hypothetical protein